MHILRSELEAFREECLVGLGTVENFIQILDDWPYCPEKMSYRDELVAWTNMTLVFQHFGITDDDFHRELNIMPIALQLWKNGVRMPRTEGIRKDLIQNLRDLLCSKVTA